MSNEEVIQGTEPSEEELLYVEIGKDILKGSVGSAQDAARQMLTISTFLAGGNLFFLSEKLTYPMARWSSLATFLLAAIVSFFAVMPASRSLCVFCPAEVKQFVDTLLGWRLSLIKTAWLLLALGFFLAILAVVLH